MRGLLLTCSIHQDSTLSSGAHVHCSHAGGEINAHQGVAHASGVEDPRPTVHHHDSDQVHPARRQANALGRGLRQADDAALPAPMGPAVMFDEVGRGLIMRRSR
jgi:hypothetical protein